MKSTSLRVLVTDDVNGQNRSAVAAVRALAAAGFQPVVSVCGRHSVAASSRFCVGRVRLPQASEASYAAALRRELETGDYLAVLPASDVALLASGSPSAELVDKHLLAEQAREAGVPTLPGRVFADSRDLVAAAHELSYPIVIKAVVKSGHQDVQARRIDEAAELDYPWPAATPLIVQPCVTGSLRAVAGVVWHGKYLALSHQRYRRLWPAAAGVGCAALTVSPDFEVEEPLLRLLAKHQGVFQAQFLGPYLLDVNPRVFGSMPLAVAAGANLPGIACAAARGRTGQLVRARPGVRYRWLEGDVRHLAQAYRAKELSGLAVLREAFPHRGTAHSIESITDPRPALERLLWAAGWVRPC